MYKCNLIRGLALCLVGAAACLGPAESGNNGTVNGSVEGAGTGSDGSMDGNVDGSAEGSADGSTNGSTDGSTNGSTDGATNGSTDGATNGSTDGSTNGSADGSTNGSTDGSGCTLTCADWSKLNPDTCECEETDDCLEEDDNCVWPGHAFSTNRCICAPGATCVNNTTIYMPPACECVEGRGYFEGGSNDRLGCWTYTVCGSNEYETVAATPTSDRQCRPLSECPPGSPELTPPTATSDRVCMVRNDPDEDGLYGLKEIVTTQIVLEDWSNPNTYINTLAVADFDRDGDIDLIDGTKWYRNDNLPFETSQFTRVDYSFVTNPAFLRAGRLTLPSDMSWDQAPLDLIARKNNSSKLFMYENEGSEESYSYELGEGNGIQRAVISSWLPTDGRDHVLYVNDDDDLQQLLFSSNGTFTERTVMTDVGPWGFQVCSKNAGERGVVFWDMNDIKWATLTNSSSPSLDYTQTVSTERLSVLACGDFDGNGQGEILATKRFSSDDVYRLYWLERAAGETAFSQRLLYEGSRSVEDVRPVDVDGDGDKDLLVALRGGEVGAYTWERMLYENNGANHFLQTSLNYNLPDDAILYGGTWADIDGDNIPEAIWYGTTTVYISRLIWNDNCPAHYNPDQADLNNDGRGNPCSQDEDLDTIHDKIDNCRFTTNTDQLDLDLDGIGDACDTDRDGDGVGNLEEGTFGTNPDNPDSDGDGFDDFVELNCNENGCPQVARDTDGDTLADALDADADDDAVLDETDNCRLNANTQQEDFDLDGFGDVCDSDADGDGFEALGDCDDMNPFAASTGWDSDCDGYADDIGRVRTILRTYNSEWPRPDLDNTASYQIGDNRIHRRGENTFIEDIDNDGDLDVIPRDAYIFYNNGGTIDQFPTYGFKDVYPQTDWVADLNGDGFPELLTAGATDLVIYKNLQDFTQIVHDPDEEPWRQYRLENAFEEITASYVDSALQAVCDNGWEIKTSGDLDGDGDVDLVTVCMHDNGTTTTSDDLGALAWHENLNNDFTFAAHLLTSGILYLNTPQMADFNGDGHQDIVFAGVATNPTWSENDGFVAWLRNDGNENFTQATLVSDIEDNFTYYGSNRQGRVSVLAADMDADHDLDIVTNNDAASYGAEWWENDGNTDPTLLDDHLIKVQSSIDDDEGFLGPFEVIDVEGDGDVDVIANNKYWFRQRDNGSFETEYVSNGGVRTKRGAIADVDADGRLDVFLLEGADHSDSSRLTWYRMHALDNCPAISNADQLDSDGDFVGDVCEE